MEIKAGELSAREQMIQEADIIALLKKWDQAIVIKYFFLLFSLRFISMISHFHPGRTRLNIAKEHPGKRLFSDLRTVFLDPNSSL